MGLRFFAHARTWKIVADATCGRRGGQGRETLSFPAMHALANMGEYAVNALLAKSLGQRDEE